MKKLLRVLLALAVCSAALCLTAAAATADGLAPVRVWGAVSPWDGNGLFLTNGDEDDPFREVVVHTGDAPVVDAATGLPLDLESVKEGDTLYAWVGPAATMSLPPQVFAEVVVGNVPADGQVPEYCKLTSGGWKNPAGGDEIVYSYRDTDGNYRDLPIPLDAEVSPWLTRQIIRLDDLRPGSRVLVWRDGTDAVTKVLVFPYAYQGYAAWSTAAGAVVNGEAVGVPGKILENGEAEERQIYLPLRAVAEAAGYEVRWDKALGAVVSLNGETVFSVRPGEDVVQTPEGEIAVSAPCLKESGVTYLPAEDLCRCLNLFF